MGNQHADFYIFRNPTFPDRKYHVFRVLKKLGSINFISIYLAGGLCFLRNLIGSSISEYPALFTPVENKMASSYVSVKEEPFSINEVAVPDNTRKATKFGN